MQRLKDWTGVSKVRALKAEQAEQKTRLNRAIDHLDEAFDRLDEALSPPPPKRERNGTE
jgi:hypothetical protein